MQYVGIAARAALAVVVAVTAAATWRLVRRRASWRLVMVALAVGAFLAGLLALFLLGQLTRPWAAVWLGVCVAFYADTLLLWRLHRPALRRAGLRW
jgi:uncharacterized membrane protein YfcA